MTLRSSRLHALALAALLLVPGCSRSAAPESKSAPPPAEAPASPAADKAGTESERVQRAPADRAAAPQGATMPGSAKRDEGAALDDLEALSSQLDHALRLSTPDCTLAPSLRDRICDLSQRICDIAARSNESEIIERCHDAKARCERATTSVRSACPE